MTEHKLTGTANIPQGCTIQKEDHTIIIKGSKGEVRRKLPDKNIQINIEGQKLILTYDKESKKQKKSLNTFLAHIENMIKGVNEGFNYKLKICSGHFPMNVAIKGDTFEIKNFIGEKVPRTLKIKTGATVKISGDIIDVDGIDKEITGQMAASIENLTKRPGFDKRIFQDGIYIIEKDGKKI